jgi:hypothetical protein
MIDLKLPNSLIESYIFANTAVFLFDKFSTDPYVLYLCNNFSTDQLIDGYNGLIKEELSGIESFVSAYALLISISLKRENNIFEIITNLETNELKWGEQIKKIAVNNIKSISISVNNYVNTQVYNPGFLVLPSQTESTQVNIISVKTYKE